MLYYFFPLSRIALFVIQAGIIIENPTNREKTTFTTLRSEFEQKKHQQQLYEKKSEKWRKNEENANKKCEQNKSNYTYWERERESMNVCVRVPFIPSRISRYACYIIIDPLILHTLL